MWDPGDGNGGKGVFTTWGWGTGGLGICYLHGSRQLHTLVVLQVGRGRHQGKAVLVVHSCQLPGVLGQSR